MEDGKTATGDTAEVAGALGDEHRASLAMLEALLFAEGTVPQRVAEPFWRGTPPPPLHTAP
jgi:hypothetical protein